MVRDVDVLRFIKAVFDFDWDDIPPLLYGSTGEQYKLSTSDVQKILESSKEVKRYDIIYKISNALLSQVYGYAGPALDPPRAKARRRAILERRATRFHNDRQVPVRTFRGWVGTRTAVGISDHNLKEKPDMSYGVERTPKLDFKWAMVPIEVEKTREVSAKDLSDVLVKQQNGIFVVLVCSLFLATFHVANR